jgi:hypothetical protein
MANGTGAALGSNASRECYTAKEIAVKLGVNYAVLIDWLNDPNRRRQLPPFKRFGTNSRGSKYVFPIKKYQEWLEGDA